jgi:hypothetical protein
VRNLAYDIYLNAAGRGRAQFQATKEPFERIVTIWDGGPAPEIEAEPLAPLGETGDRARVMKRIEQTFHWLRSDVNTPMRLQDDLDRVIRETSVMAALGTALSDSSFDSATDEAYRALLQQFIDGHLGMQAAAKTGDFSQFEQSRDAVQKSCDACHAEYRTGSSDL